MKKTLKKITAMLLTALFMVNLIPTSVFALSGMAEETEEALAFIESKGLIMGEVVDVYTVDNGYMFKVLLDTNEETIIEYIKTNNDITIKITEEHASNTLQFKESGVVYLDGVITDIFSNNNNIMTADTGGYVYTYYETVAAAEAVWGPWVCTETTYINDVIAFAKAIRLLTKPIISAAIGAVLKVPAKQVFSLAEMALNLAINYQISDTQLSISHTNFKDARRGPLQYMTRGVTICTSSAGSSTGEYWEMATLA